MKILSYYKKKLTNNAMPIRTILIIKKLLQMLTNLMFYIKLLRSKFCLYLDKSLTCCKASDFISLFSFKSITVSFLLLSPISVLINKINLLNLSVEPQNNYNQLKVGSLDMKSSQASNRNQKRSRQCKNNI